MVAHTGSNRPPRVLVLSEIPTPYRLPFYRDLAARPELELEVAFCALGEPDRPWELGHELAGVPHRVLSGFAPAIRTRRNTFVYQINPGILGLLGRGSYDALVIGGYAVFAEQVAIAFAKARRVPYLLHSESHAGKSRPGLLRAAKRAVLPRVIGGAAAGLAVGSAASRYLQDYGLPAERIRIVPNTIDVAAFAELAARARAKAGELRRQRDLPERYVLFVGRLVGDKGIPELLEALRLLGRAAPQLLVAGTGPLASDVAAAEGVRLVGFQDRDSLIELYALAEATVLPSRSEPWGVVVNEALAAGCPVVASDGVGAVEDLVVDGVNGRVFPVRDAGALAAALAAGPPSGDPARGAIERWDYAFAVEQFLEALRIALPGRLPEAV